MTDHQQAKIKNRVAKTLQDKRRQKQVVKAQNVIVPRKERSSFVGTFLVTCILLLAVATVPVMYFKGQERSVTVEPSTQVQVDQVAEDTPVLERESQQDVWNNALSLRLSEVEGDSKKQQYRLWLLILAHNENANLNRQMESRHHNVEDRGYITFDEDWHLNKLPETMKFTPEQLEKINVPK